MRSCSPAGRRLAGRRSCMYYMCMRVGVYVRFACVRQRSCFFCFLVVCGFCFFFFLLRPPLSQSGIFVFLHYVNSRPVCVTGSPGGLNLLQEKKETRCEKESLPGCLRILSQHTYILHTRMILASAFRVRGSPPQPHSSIYHIQGRVSSSHLP